MKWALFLLLILNICACGRSRTLNHTESTGVCYVVLKSVCFGATCRVDLKEKTEKIQLPLAKNFERMRVTIPFLTVKDDVICKKVFIGRYSDGNIFYERKFWDFKEEEQKLETGR